MIIFTLTCALFLFAWSRVPALKIIKMDSLGHFFGFFVLSWILHLWVKLPSLTTMFGLIFYAALTELGQYYLGFRRGELRDVFADGLGVIAFFSFVYINNHFYSQIKKPKSHPHE